MKFILQKYGEGLGGENYSTVTRGEWRDDRIIQVPQIRGIIKSDTQQHYLL